MVWTCLLAAGTAAENAEDNKASRLGFKFDQTAHDAVVAAAQSRADKDAPLPPGVIRLPRHEVTTRAVPQNDRMLTPKGRIALAERRYETDFYRAVIGPIEALASLLNNPLGGWNPNAPEALALHEDEERHRRATEMSDLLDLAALADAAKAPAPSQTDSKRPAK